MEEEHQHPPPRACSALLRTLEHRLHRKKRFTFTTQEGIQNQEYNLPTVQHMCLIKMHPVFRPSCDSLAAGATDRTSRPTGKLPHVLTNTVTLSWSQDCQPGSQSPEPGLNGLLKPYLRFTLLSETKNYGFVLFFNMLTISVILVLSISFSFESRSKPL